MDSFIHLLGVCLECRVSHLFTFDILIRYA